MINQFPIQQDLKQFTISINEAATIILWWQMINCNPSYIPRKSELDLAVRLRKVIDNELKIRNTESTSL